MKKIKLILFILINSFRTADCQTSWQSALVSVDKDGTITYQADNDGFQIPDFSHAGYKGGGVELPVVAVVKTISPIAGDNTENIQAAINSAGSLPKDANGMRGAVLLNAGVYEVYGSIYVKYDGVVLRGVGQGTDPLTSSIIYAKGNTPVQRDVIVLGYSFSQINGNIRLSGTTTNISDPIVPVGSCTFNVDNSSLYHVGDRIIINHPCTQAWITAVKQGGVPYPNPSDPIDTDERWMAGQLPIVYNRFIINVSGSVITVDAPVFYTLNKSVAQSYCYKPDMNQLISQVGLENLRIDVETSGGVDENHAWQASRFKSCENSWATNCTFIHFGQSGIITEACTRSTFLNCTAIDPVAVVIGQRMYNFNTSVYSQLNLFSNCYARNGRHHYISNGTSSTSGNVFLRCTSDAINCASEGHRHWTQGMLYDNLTEINLKQNLVLGLYNRVDMGTGHGWAAVHSVLWNCNVDSTYGKIALQQPPTAQNYAIGCFARLITGNPVRSSNFALGYVEGQNKPGLTPVSLYEAQLAARIRLNASVKTQAFEQSVSLPTCVANSLNINIKNNNWGMRVYIRSSEGKIIHIIDTKENSYAYNTSKLSSGIYRVEYFTDSKLYSSLFIKI